MTQQEEKLLNAVEASELTGLAPATLRKMAWQQRIRSYKVLGCLRFRKSDLQELIIERPVTRESSVPASGTLVMQEDPEGPVEDGR